MCPSIHESQILVSFALQPADFEIHAIFRQVRRMTPKRSYTLNSQIILYTPSTSYPQSANFRQFFSTSSHFQDTGLVKFGNVPNDLRLTLES